jgi:histone H3/H4
MKRLIQPAKRTASTHLGPKRLHKYVERTKPRRKNTVDVAAQQAQSGPDDVEFVFAKLDFGRAARTVLEGLDAGLSMRPDAVRALHEATERWVGAIIGEACNLAEGGNKRTIGKNDILAAASMHVSDAVRPMLTE